MYFNISIQNNNNKTITHIHIFLCTVWYFHNLGWPLHKLKIPVKDKHIQIYFYKVSSYIEFSYHVTRLNAL